MLARISSRLAHARVALTVAVAALGWASAVYAFSVKTLASIPATIGANHCGFCFPPPGPLAPAGDFNGDGYPDIVIGENAATSTGRVRILFGGAAADTTTDLVFNGLIAGEDFGTSAASAGDFNGDGYDDLIVGAPYSTNGKAYVYFGGTSPNTTVDLTLTGKATGDGFGAQVAGVGDFDGDGFDDIAVSAPYHEVSGGGVDGGEVSIFYGGTSPNTVEDYTYYSVNPGAYVGGAIMPVGDTDGDGRGEFVVSEINANRVAMLVNVNGLLGLPHYVLAAGDMNGDGLSDLVTTYFGHTIPGRTNLSQVAVLLGSAFPDTIPDFFSATPGNNSIDSWGTVADVTGDGVGDAVIALRNPSNSGVALAILQGGPTLAGIVDGEVALSYSGLSGMTPLGDWNQDGLADIGIAASKNLLFSPYAYRIHAPALPTTWVAGATAQIAWAGNDRADVQLSVDGGASWLTVSQTVGGEPENVATFAVPDLPGSAVKVRLLRSGQEPTRANLYPVPGSFSIAARALGGPVVNKLRSTTNGSVAGEAFGTKVASAGDVNGDGYPDMIVGAPNASTGAGRASIYLGGPGEDGVADIVLSGAAGENLGTAVAGAGDVNGDGFDDVIVGAPLNDTGFTDAGRAYVYFGGANMNATADVTLSGVETLEEIGMAVAGLGDVNQDGFDDVAVGAPLSNSAASDAGRVYVLFGGAAMNNVVDVTLAGTTANENFGKALAGGDVNGDGLGDVVVGSPQFSTTSFISRGRMSVYFGGSIMNSVADLQVNGDGNEEFANALATGDVSGDGVADILAGAQSADLGGTNAGAVRVFFGGAALDSVPDFVLAGGAAGDQFGAALAFAGDVNGDRIGDFLVAAPFADPLNVSSAGRVSVYFGGALSSTPGAVFTGSSVFEDMGRSVAGLGDLTGDGIADIALGEPDADTPLTDAGRVLVYDLKRFLLQSPNGGDTWNVGALQTVKWLGAEPADVWLSDDGGTSWTQVAARVGGDAANQIRVRVPHQPSRFAMVRLTPANTAVTGFDNSDSLFTIQASIALLGLSVATAPSGAGVEVSWNTNPGPADLAGYTLERAIATSGDVPSRGAELDATRWVTVVERTTDTRVVDAEGTTSSRYRLTAINGLGEALVLGETNALPPTPLSAGPLPYRGGDLIVRFASVGDIGGAAAPVHVGVYDAQGRLIRTLVDRAFGPGMQSTRWDGRDARGHEVPRGLYALRASTTGRVTTQKLVVLR